MTEVRSSNLSATKYMPLQPSNQSETKLKLKLQTLAATSKVGN